MKTILIFLMGFLGLGALIGGIPMILDPSGKMLGVPSSMLETSPFSDFLVPGIILFMVLGLIPCFLVYALVKKPRFTFAEQLNAFRDMHWSWSFTIYIGFALIIWITVQVAIINSGVFWLHTFYTFLGIAILFMALLPKIRHYYRKHTIH